MRPDSVSQYGPSEGRAVGASRRSACRIRSIRPLTVLPRSRRSRQSAADHWKSAQRFALSDAAVKAAADRAAAGAAKRTSEDAVKIAADRAEERSKAARDAPGLDAVSTFASLKKP